MRRASGHLPPPARSGKNAPMRTVSLVALRRLAIAAQGYSSRSRAGTSREVEAAIRRLSCVQLDSISAVERSHRIALSCRVGAYPEEAVPRLLGSGPRLRVLGPRGLPAPRRGVAALRLADEAGRPQVVRRRRRDAPPPCRGDPGRDPGARAARLAALRGRERARGRDVELEAGEGDARSPLEPRRSRDRGPAGVPAPLRPARAGDSEGGSRRARPGRARAVAGARDQGGRRARRADRRGCRRALAAAGRRRPDPSRARRARRGRAFSSGVAVEDGGAPVVVPAGAALDPAPPTAAVLLSPSTTSSGTGRSHVACSASTT